MAQSSNLWPNGGNKDLLIAIANYLQDMVTSNKSLDELHVDSLQVVTESLQTIICPDGDDLPKAPFTLEALYAAYTKDSSSSSSNDDEKRPPLPANIAQRRKKFLEFIAVLKQHDFFKNCAEGSAKFTQRMEKARTQYNSRFAAMSIDHLSWLEDADPAPMDTDDAAPRVISEADKQQAEALKAEGNKLLGQKAFAAAIEKYSAAIKLNNRNAVYFSNRAAAHTYLKNFDQAVADARQASEIDPAYVKAYVREGLAEYELGHFQKAHDAYSKALSKTKASDKNWETYMEKVELCQMKLDQQSSANANPSAAASNPMADLMSGLGGGGAGGGGPDLAGLLGQLGGGGGAGGGGLDFAALMKNPMMQQMAQQMMSDPNAMKKMGDMMGQMGGAMGAQGGGGGGGGDDGMSQVMADLMRNPQKAQQLFAQAMADPEVKQMMRDDPTLEPLIGRIKGGDYAAFMELGSKPEAMRKVKQLVKKYYDK